MRNFSDLIDFFLDIVELLIPLVAALSLLAFFKGLLIFIAKSGDAASHKEGRNLMLWGIIGLFIMTSVFGILGLAYTDFGFSRPFGIPYLPE